MLQMKVLRADIGIPARSSPEIANTREMEVESQDLQMTGYKFGIQ